MKKIASIVSIIFLILISLTIKASLETSTDEDAIKMAALDYIDGAHEGSSARMERAVHPELNKVIVETIQKTGKSYLRKAGSTRLVQIVGAKVAVLDKDQRNIEVKILDVLESMENGKS
jgi:hypothetical protein